MSLALQTIIPQESVLTPSGRLLPREPRLTFTYSPDAQSAASVTRPARRSRWDAVPCHCGIPSARSGLPGVFPASLRGEQATAVLLRGRLEEIGAILTGNSEAAARGEPVPFPGGGRERSPSPPPTYDGQGRRTNTREMRIRGRLEREKERIVVSAGEYAPGFAASAASTIADVGDGSGKGEKKTIKFYVPGDDPASATAVLGLLLGPGGRMHKKIELESGARVSIKGRVPGRENQVRRRQDAADANEPMNIVIQGDTQEQVDAAYNMIKPLIAPMPRELREECRRAQQLALAEITGTGNALALMAGLGPDASAAALVTAEAGQRAAGMGAGVYDSGVVCSICGDRGHPAIDCPFKGLPPEEVPRAKKMRKAEESIDAFMAQIGMGPPSGNGNNNNNNSSSNVNGGAAEGEATGMDEGADKDISEFLAAVGQTSAEEAPRTETAGMQQQVYGDVVIADDTAGYYNNPPPPGVLPNNFQYNFQPPPPGTAPPVPSWNPPPPPYPQNPY